MPLKPDRLEIETDISHMMNEVATRGIIVCIASGGSGIGVTDRDNVVTAKAYASGGNPLGMLLTDVVNVDTTKFHVNQHKEEVQKGNKVTVGVKGWWVTDQVLGSPTVGQKAFLDASGKISATDVGTAQTPQVGRFLTVKDSSGYLKVAINLPQGVNNAC